MLREEISPGELEMTSLVDPLSSGGRVWCQLDRLTSHSCFLESVSGQMRSISFRVRTGERKRSRVNRCLLRWLSLWVPGGGGWVGLAAGVNDPMAGCLPGELRGAHMTFFGPWN